MIEMIRTADRLSPEQIGQVINNLTGVLADYVCQSHLPEEDKVLIAAAWAVLSSNEDRCRCDQCKDTGVTRLSGFIHGEFAWNCDESPRCEELANGTWLDAITTLEDIWGRTRCEDAQRQIAEKTDMALKALGVVVDLEDKLRCAHNFFVAYCGGSDCHGKWFP